MHKIFALSLLLFFQNFTHGHATPTSGSSLAGFSVQLPDGTGRITVRNRDTVTGGSKGRWDRF